MSSNALIITSGSFKNAKLQIPPSDFTRPSKMILRESLLNSLQNELFESCFVEVFGGSGQVGICARSRGARSSIFIEKQEVVFKVLQNNISYIKKTFQTSKMDVFFGDSLELLPRILKKLEGAFILFFDPPFPQNDDKNIYKNCLLLCAKLDLTRCKYIIFESHSGVKMPENIQKLSRIKQKIFGKSALVSSA